MTSTAQKDQHGNIEWRNEKGQLHRENGPAVELADGSKCWYVNGQQHREDGPAVIFSDGATMWYQKDRKHREGGPAIEYNIRSNKSTKEWYRHGQRHRENGPAIEYANGTVEYWFNGQKGPETEQKVKENMARLQAQKDRQELLNGFSQDDEISAKINRSSFKIPKKL